MDRQTAIVRCFGQRDKKRHKRVVNVVVSMTRKVGVRWSQATIKKFVRNRNQAYIRARRVRRDLIDSAVLSNIPKVTA